MPHRAEKFREGDLMHHGVYGQLYASTKVIRHKYGTTGSEDDRGYFEILEFPSPPEGRKPAVFHIFSDTSGHVFFRFDSVEEALNFDFNKEVGAAIEGRGPVPPHLVGMMEQTNDVLPWFFHPHVLIVDTPAGSVPEKIRNAWVGAELPTKGRGDRGVAMGRTGCRGYRVAGADALEVLREHNPKAALWWEKNFFNFQEIELIFDAKVCKEI